MIECLCHRLCAAQIWTSIFDLKLLNAYKNVKQLKNSLTTAVTASAIHWHVMTFGWTQVTRF